MKHKARISWIIGIIVVLAVIIAEQINYRSRVKRLEESLMKEDVPLPDYSKGNPLFYSIQKKAWIYSTQPGAIAPRKIEEPYEDHETYLKRKIPKYKKKTYWGEEWDEETGQEKDIIWDDDGDDDEIEKLT